MARHTERVRRTLAWRWVGALAFGVLAATLVAIGSSTARTVTVTLKSTSRAVPPNAPVAGLTRYSLAHGCYSLQSPSGAPIAAADGPFTMQPAALGIYLLYGPTGDYLADQGAGTPASVGTPGPAAEWQVTGDARAGFTLTNLASKASQPVRFAPASGCATYPEASVDATGRGFTGASPEADVRGTVEGHAHVTAFDFLGGDWHCGRPWSPFGAPYALPASCADEQKGTNGLFESFVDFGGLTRPAMHGWPTFAAWPSPTALAEEGDYYTGLERAWKAGLRLLVTDLVDNEALCTIMTTRHNPCNDMDGVRIQSHDLYALQDYIDAQSGGPGKGWFRIVTNPFQARRVINQGKLAVIEGIEVSRIFGCGEVNGVPQCDEHQIDAGLKEIHDLGVRTFFPIHEFNNAFGGTKMIAGTLGTIVNIGNRYETGSFWTVQPCSARTQDAEQVTLPVTGALAGLVNGPLASLLHGAPLPVYGSGPQCNTRGLTDLGTYLINQMIKQHFIIQTDHMDSQTAAAAVAIAAAHHYSGVVSAHCCSSPQLFGQIYATGGFVTPPVEPAAAFVATEKVDKAVADPRYHFGFGWGSDENGLAEQPGPSSGSPITYPFTSYDGHVTFTREQWGNRTFDLNKDGLANYGMYADWLREVQQIGGAPVMNDMFQGAEAYLESWERADGVPATSCRRIHERFNAHGLGSTLRLGQTTRAALFSAGQPSSRPGRVFRYCVGAGHRAVAAVFGATGRVAMIASTAPGDVAGGVHPGESVTRLGRGIHRVAPGVWAGRKLVRGARFVYAVRHRRVHFVALAAHGKLLPVATAAQLRAAGI